MFKRWVLNLPFVRSAMSKAAQQFTADQLGQMKRYEQFKLQEVDELADKKLNALLSTIDKDKIVRLEKSGNGGIVYIGGIRATEAQLANLKSEAEFLMKSDLWHLIYETPKELAQQQMFVKSESLDDLKKGKSILYTLDVQKNLVNTFLSYTKK